MLFDNDLPQKRKAEPVLADPQPQKKVKTYESQTFDIDEQLQRELRQLYEATDNELASLKTQIPQSNIPKRNHHQAHKEIPEIGRKQVPSLNLEGRVTSKREETEEVEIAVAPAPEDYEPLVRKEKFTGLPGPVSPTLDNLKLVDDPLEPLPLEPAVRKKPPLEISTPKKAEPKPMKPVPMANPFQQQAQMMGYYQMMQSQWMRNPALYQAHMMQYMKMQQANMFQQRQMRARMQHHQQDLLARNPSQPSQEEFVEPPNMGGLFKGL